MRRLARARAPWKWIILLATVVFPRMMVSGGLPSTDEGVFAYFAQIAHASLVAGHGLPHAGTLALYPILVSWVFAAEANHIVLLRLVDMLVAFAASWILYDVIFHECQSRLGAAVICAIVLFTENQPIFIQAGFKNSIFAAFVPLFAAMRTAQSAHGADDVRWLACGALVGLAILLRETFLPFIVVGAVAVFVFDGPRALLRFVCGAGLAGLAVLLAMVGARGGIQSLIDGYRDAAALYASMSGLRRTLLLNSGTAFVNEAWLALGMGLVSVLATIGAIAFDQRRELLGRLLFWLSVASVPLIEPLSKIAFPYHFSVCLPGIAGLAALSWRAMLGMRAESTRLAIAASMVIVALWAMAPKFVFLMHAWPSTRLTLASAAEGKWPADAVTKSNYLAAADAIKKFAPIHGTLSISGFMFALFPLTGLLPRTYETSHLTALLIKLRMNEQAFRSSLSACPPDVLMTTTRKDWPGSELLEKAVRESKLYEQVAVIPVDPSKSYGNFGGTIFRRVRAGDTICAGAGPRAVEDTQQRY